MVHCSYSNRSCTKPGGGTKLWVTRHVPPKRPYFFSLAFTKRPPFLPTFTQWHPIFNKLLVTERPWHIFVTQRPLIFAFNDKFDEMLRNFWSFWPWKPLFYDAFQWKTSYFCALCHWKTHFFDAICHGKTPTSEVLGGTRTSLSYVSAPLPPGAKQHSHCQCTLTAAPNRDGGTVLCYMRST